MARLYGPEDNLKHAYHKATDEDFKIIADLEYTNHPGGVVHFHNAIDFDSDVLLPYIDNMAYVPSCGLEIIKDEDGNMLHGQTFDGQIVSMDDLLALPMRVGGMGMPEPVNPGTPENIRETFEYFEEMMYFALMRYVDLYPLVVNQLWWRARGHCLKYLPGASLGIHNDNDTNSLIIDGQRHYSGREIAMYQVTNCLVYLNEEYEGGEMHFPYLDISVKPKRGDMIFFPANYIGTHGVAPVTSGERYTYLAQYGHGGLHKYEVKEPTESVDWLCPVFMPFLYQDTARFMASEYSHFSSENSRAVGLDAATVHNQERSTEGPPVGEKLEYGETWPIPVRR